MERTIYTPEESHGQLLKKAEILQYQYPTIGLMGGMGPDATADLYRAINNNTRLMLGAVYDQDHIPLLIASTPQTPDRTKFILQWLGKSTEPAEDPMPYLVRAYLDLRGDPSRAQQVKFIGIPCNTAHFFAPALQEFIREDGSDIQIVHMIEETERAMKEADQSIKKVGLLATTATIQTDLYSSILEDRGFVVVKPDEEDQENLVMEAIYGYKKKKGIKSGFLQEPRELLLQASERLKKQGADAVIMGCTEIPLVLSQNDSKEVGVQLVNPTDVLARRLIALTATERRAA